MRDRTLSHESPITIALLIAILAGVGAILWWARGVDKDIEYLKHSRCLCVPYRTVPSEDPGE